MADVRRCPQCQTELPADAPEGVCPKCLIQLGLESEQGSQPEAQPAETSPHGSRFVPPKPEELAERFPQLEILELVGCGGMGAVYKARQPHLDRLVALKILPREVGRDPAFAERFAREARALARLSHPSIVAVHDFGQAEGVYYFVMEFVDGANLREMIQAGRLEPQQALAIVPQICEALQFAHEEGVVHRDIKPENVLIDKRGRVKIADFGLAKLLGKAPAEWTLTGTHQAMGTPHYMAPEQMERPLEVDHRADIYSLGVVFYEMLTGELPIGRFAPPSKKVQVDVRLDEVVLRALEKEPERRYQHASEVKTDVDTITAQSQPQLPALRSSQAVGSHADLRDDESTRRILGALRWLLACVNVVVAVLAFALSPPGSDWSFKLGTVNDSEYWIGLPGPLAIALVSLILSVGVYVFVSALVRSRVKAHAESPRICKLPVIGAFWAPFGLLAIALALIAVPVAAGETPEVTPWQWFTRLVILPLGGLAPFACTTLGCLGISRIRSSQGRLIGMPLAVGVALFYPLLLLDAVLLGVTYGVAAESRYLILAMAIALLIVVVLDWLIVRAAWKAATRPARGITAG